MPLSEQLLEVQGAIKESDERAKRDEASRTEHQYETKEITVRRRVREEVRGCTCVRACSGRTRAAACTWRARCVPP